MTLDQHIAEIHSAADKTIADYRYEQTAFLDKPSTLAMGEAWLAVRRAKEEQKVAAFATKTIANRDRIVDDLRKQGKATLEQINRMHTPGFWLNTLRSL